MAARFRVLRFVCGLRSAIAARGGIELGLPHTPKPRHATWNDDFSASPGPSVGTIVEWRHRVGKIVGQQGGQSSCRAAMTAILCGRVRGRCAIAGISMRRRGGLRWLAIAFHCHDVDAIALAGGLSRPPAAY